LRIHDFYLLACHRPKGGVDFGKVYVLEEVPGEYVSESPHTGINRFMPVLPKFGAHVAGFSRAVESINVVSIQRDPTTAVLLATQELPERFVGIDSTG
jgi:hypothetical protein